MACVEAARTLEEGVLEKEVLTPKNKIKKDRGATPLRSA
jgi:hypothetical protein